MVTVQDVLGDLDDMKSALYDIVERGALDENINDQVQELLREVYGMLEEEQEED
jgi:hypothetical protein